MATRKKTQSRAAPGDSVARKRSPASKTATKKTTPRRGTTRRKAGAGPAPERTADVELVQAGALESGLKQEATGGPEETFQGRFYRPVTDIYETGDALILVTEVPGATAEGVAVQLDGDVLSVIARVDVGNYAGLAPLAIEYNVGHFARRFRLPGSVDPDGIEATLSDGVLVLELAKAPAYRTRRIPVE